MQWMLSELVAPRHRAQPVGGGGRMGLHGKGHTDGLLRPVAVPQRGAEGDAVGRKHENFGRKIKEKLIDIKENDLPLQRGVVAPRTMLPRRQRTGCAYSF